MSLKLEKNQNKEASGKGKGKNSSPNSGNGSKGKNRSQVRVRGRVFFSKIQTIIDYYCGVNQNLLLSILYHQAVTKDERSGQNRKDYGEEETRGEPSKAGPYETEVLDQGTSKKTIRDGLKNDSRKVGYTLH